MASSAQDFGIDPLTGALSPTRFNEILEREILLNKRTKSLIQVVTIEISSFHGGVIDPEIIDEALIKLVYELKKYKATEPPVVKVISSTQIITKEKLAKLAGVAPGHFVQVKSPFQAREITASLDPENTQLIFVRSEKDADKPPQAGGVKKNGEPAYLQPLEGQQELAPMSQHAYMAYLPTVEFGPGMTSATEIRAAWPHLNDRRKDALVMSLYPRTQGNPKLAANIVKMLDTAIVSEEVMSPIAENQGWAATYNEQSRSYDGQQGAGMWAGYQQRENQPVDEDYVEEKWSAKYKRSINCNNPQGFSQKAHCAGRKK